MVELMNSPIVVIFSVTLTCLSIIHRSLSMEISLDFQDCCSFPLRLHSPNEIIFQF